MTSMQIFALALLAFVFLLSFWRHINLGLAVLPGAFVLALVADVPMKTLFQGYPAQLTILVLGVMFLWNHVQESGLASVVVKYTVKLSCGRVYLLPWTMFVLMAVISGIGALPAAAFAIVIPVALEIAKRENISLTMMGIVSIQGACVGGFSPLNPWAALVTKMALDAKIDFLPGQFFLVNAALATTVAFVGFLIFGGVELFRRGTVSCQATTEEILSETDKKVPLSAYLVMSALSVVTFIAMVLMKFDIGLTGFLLGFILMIIFHDKSKKPIQKLPWAIVIMIAGVLMYVHLLDVLGVLKAIGSLLASMENPSFVRVGVTYLGTIIANFEASSIAVLGFVIPVAIKSMSADLGATAATMQLAILSGSIVVMCSSPFHIGGALVLAEAGGDERVYKNLLIWSISLAAILPLFAFLI